eukprot:COSAG03_NODE_894_length_5464_cov_8.128984_2_plen_50_part_00
MRIAITSAAAGGEGGIWARQGPAGGVLARALWLLLIAGATDADALPPGA